MSEVIQIVKENPNVSNWDRDTGYVKGVLKNAYPLRSFNKRELNGLAVHLRLYERDIEYEYACRGPTHSFEVFLTTPGEISRQSHQSFQFPLMQEISVSIRPKLETTSKDLRSYTPMKRQCYFSTDRQLRFFRFYSKRNCHIECLANYTLKECGCVKFSMPSID